jgi:hypothetical protein
MRGEMTPAQTRPPSAPGCDTQQAAREISSCEHATTERSPFELYIYYRAPVSARHEVHLAASALQSDLAHQFQGLQARLLRRLPDDAAQGAAHASAHDTWMEIYRFHAGSPIPAGFETELAQAAENTLAGWLTTPRKIERFFDPGH